MKALIIQPHPSLTLFQAMSPIERPKNIPLHECEHQNNGSALLTITLLVHRNWCHSSLPTDG